MNQENKNTSGNEPNVQALAPAVAETALQNSEQNPEATDGCQQRSCSGIQACQATVNWVWIDWNEVACINGVNNQELSTVNQEIEIIFKSGKALKVSIGEMMGFKTLSDCPLTSHKAFEKQILLLDQYAHELGLRKELQS